MILKLYQVNSQVNAFFDGFAYVNTSVITRKDMEQEGFSCAISAYVCVDDLKILRLQLMNPQNDLIRVVYVGVCYNAYLLSNEGKTIERIN